MNLDQIRSELSDLIADRALLAEDNLDVRAEAREFLAFVQRVVRTLGGGGELDAVEREAASLERALEAVDEGMYRRLRAEIAGGCHSPASLRRRFDRYTDYAPGQNGQAHVGYDGLDALVNGLLLVDPVPGETVTRTAEMVQYEATPARAILDLFDHVELSAGDVFYDLGAGLGHVVMLVHLLTGVRTRGVEIDPAFCAYARAAAGRLGLEGVTFIQADARQADYSDGTVFYLFTPFVGSVLGAVLERLQWQARLRRITVCTYGSCTLHVAKQAWLESADANADHEFKLAVFRSR